MLPVATVVALQTATSTPGIGPAELVDFWPSLRRVGWFIAGFLIVALLGWFLVEPAISQLIRRRNRDNPTIQEAISRYLRMFVLVVAVFVGAGTAGYGQFLSNSALVIAAATLAIGVAGQTVIGSLVSGIVLVLDPEFNIGNYIKWEDGEGTIQSITLRVTRVQTQKGELVTIPNSVLTSQAITRPYGRGRTRVVEQIGLAYEADVVEAMQILTDACREIDGIVSEPAPSAYVDELGGDAVVLRVHYWIENPRQQNIFEIKSTYAQAIKDRLEAAGITVNPASKRELQGRIAVENEPNHRGDET